MALYALLYYLTTRLIKEQALLRKPNIIAINISSSAETSFK